MTPERRRAGFETLASSGVNTILTESDTYDPRSWPKPEAGLAFWGGISCFLHLNSTERPRAHARSLTPILATGERRPTMEWYNGVPSRPPDPSGGSAWTRSTRILREHDSTGSCSTSSAGRCTGRSSIDPATPSTRQLVRRSHPREFREFAGVDVPTDDPAEASTWIMEASPAQWIDFKCDVITSFVAAARGAFPQQPGSRHLSPCASSRSSPSGWVSGLPTFARSLTGYVRRHTTGAVPHSGLGRRERR